MGADPGGLTTYRYQTERLVVEEGSVPYGCLNALASLTAGLGAAPPGLTIASAVRP